MIRKRLKTMKGLHKIIFIQYLIRGYVCIGGVGIVLGEIILCVQMTSFAQVVLQHACYDKVLFNVHILSTA